MNKINYFLGYIFFRILNRYKSNRKLVTPESYAGGEFFGVIFFPLFLVWFKFANYMYSTNKDSKIFMYIFFFIITVTMFYSFYLEKWVKRNSDQFIKHKWNKLPIVFYSRIFQILILIIMLLIV